MITFKSFIPHLRSRVDILPFLLWVPIIKITAQRIREFMAISNEVKEFDSLRDSIEESVSVGVGSKYNPKGLVYDRRVKFSL